MNSAIKKKTRSLAILFPGLGYTTMKPLFYYGKKVLTQHGYQIEEVNYDRMEHEEFFKELKNTLHTRHEITGQGLLQFLSRALELVEIQLKGIDFSAYDQVFFLSKSIGCVLAMAYAKKLSISPVQFLLTPLEQTFQLGQITEGAVFYGTADFLVKEAAITNYCKENNILSYAVNNGNHSLETGDFYEDLDNLKRYVAELDAYVLGLSQSVYDFEVLSREQKPVPLSNYRGKVLLIVNTATGCGFTPQYTKLEELYEQFHPKGFELLDFPCNQFAQQAPGSSEEIYSFCTSQYNIRFPQFAKIKVNGPEQSKLFEYLKSKKGFQGFDLSTPDGRFLARKIAEDDPDYEHNPDIKWNFTKFLVNPKGQVVARYEPLTDLELIKKDIEQMLP